MKILIVTNLFPPQILGGYEILCRQVTEGTQATRPPGRSAYYRLCNRRNPSPDPSKTKALLALSSALLEDSIVCVSGPPISTTPGPLLRSWNVFGRIWCSFGANADSPSPACGRPRNRGYSTAFTFNDEYLSFYKPHRLLGPLSCQGLDFTRSTCISRRLRSRLGESGLPVRNSKIIYQGIPLECFPLCPEPGERFKRLLYVGQLHHYKGVHQVILAAHQLEMDLTVVGVGDPDYERQLRSLAKNGPARVRFLGQVKPEKVPNIYRTHDAFVFPSLWQEPFGLTHLEAMASGLPVVSTLRGGQAEFLKPEINCLAFEGRRCG